MNPAKPQKKKPLVAGGLISSRSAAKLRTIRVRSGDSLTDV
jgi:hypothetical protein